MWKLYRQTDGRTDERQASRKAHLGFKFRWAKFIEGKNVNMTSWMPPPLDLVGTTNNQLFINNLGKLCIRDVNTISLRLLNSRHTSCSYLLGFILVVTLLKHKSCQNICNVIGWRPVEEQHNGNNIMLRRDYERPKIITRGSEFWALVNEYQISSLSCTPKIYICRDLAVAYR